MFTHKDIWAAIDQHANDMGYSPSSLAKAAGLDPTAFNKSKRMSTSGKPRWPSTESIAKILEATNTDTAAFMALINAPARGTAPPASVKPLPFLSSHDAERDGLFTSARKPDTSKWATYHYKEHDIDPQSFAIKATDNMFTPVLRNGHIAIAHRIEMPQTGQRILAKHCANGLFLYDVYDRKDSTLTFLPVDPNKKARTDDIADYDWFAAVQAIITE